MRCLADSIAAPVVGCREVPALRRSGAQNKVLGTRCVPLGSLVASGDRPTEIDTSSRERRIRSYEVHKSALSFITGNEILGPGRNLAEGTIPPIGVIAMGGLGDIRS